MKIPVALMLILRFASLGAQSPEHIAERIYTATDKTSYVAGDQVCISVFCFDLSQNKLSSFSSLAYLELISKNGVAITEKISLANGRGSGIITIPANLPTGNYALVAYTRQNRNEEGFFPQGKIISVFNILSTDKIEDNVNVSKAAGSSSQNPHNTNTKEGAINIFSQNCAPLSSSTVSLKNEGLYPVTLCIGVTHRDSVTFPEKETIKSYCESLESAKAGLINNKYIPDYEGEVIDIVSDAIGKKVFLSFMGDRSDVYLSEVDQNGKAFFITGNTYGENNAVLQVMAGYSSSKHTMELVSPFIGAAGYEFPLLQINPGMESSLIQRGMGMQIMKRFGGDTLFQMLPKREDVLLGEADKTYILDDYTRFPTMIEVLTEFVTEIRPRNTEGHADFKVFNKDEFSYLKSSALVLVDGVPVSDHQRILDYDPLLVKQIRIYTDTYVFSNIAFKGVVCFDTYKGNLPSFNMEDNVSLHRFKGALYPQSITGKEFKGKKNFPDYRQTLYWHPQISIAPGETFEFDCITPKYKGDFDIVAEGVNSEGNPVYVKSSFKVL